ncbi:MAG: TetR family transcriptional regulator C-terminal domain-containing protein [Streptomyces sp.]|uniref:TetR/AcrR family transcriptional regulator n=1 Tax=Streptomyces sp. TaxID=1931 RepID=UPI0025EFF72C|nr:TetR family transcriptional regulator C-terminal domain-containing protein [Streptomyces sp.]MBW8793386.1 TetR family transcriptional regulator C-terminal domain-containing protein [Streptomyces sp.]
MTSRAGKRVRKAPAERRGEIVATAARIGLTEGLECVTLRRIADELGVQPGLVGHYFPAADELVAEAFTHATMRELDGLLPPEPDDPLRTFRRFFGLTTSAEFDDVSKLWLNARHLSRYRPVLREHVMKQELLWCRRLEELIAAGTAAGPFACADPWGAATRVLVAIDGASAYVNTTVEHRRTPTADMPRTVAESELGLERGMLLAD